jgi:hypothetical protein
MPSSQVSAERSAPRRVVPRPELPSLLLGFVMLVLALVAGGAVEAAGLRAASHDGYGRLVFDFDRASGFKASVEGGKLVINFDQPFAAKLDAAARTLDSYVGQGTLSADRRTATFPLKRPVSLRSFGNERSVVIDLVDAPAPDAAPKPAANVAAPTPTEAAPAAKPTTEAAAAPKPAEAAPAPAAPPPGPASRPSVSMPMPPPFKPAEQAAAPKSADAAPAPKPVEAAAAPKPIESSVTAPAKETPQAAAKPAPSSSPAAEVHGPAVPVRIGQHDDFTRLVFEWPSAVNYKVSSDGPVTRLDFDHAGTIDVERLRRSLPRAVGGFDAVSGPDGLSVAMAIPVKATVRHFRNGNSIVLDVLAPPGAAPAAADTAASLPSPTPAAAPAPSSDTKAAPAAAEIASNLLLSEPVPGPVREPRAFDGPVPTISLTATATPQAIVIGVPWQPLPAAAIFARGGYIYMVFDHPAAFDFAALRRVGPRISNPEQLALAEGGALRFQISNGYGARILRTGDGWQLTVRPDTLRPETELPVIADSASGAVAVGISGALPPIAVPDPELGDMLQVVPIAVAGRGLTNLRSFALFSVLPSLQGVVVAPRGDGVQVRTEANRVMIGTISALAGAPSTIAPGTAKFFEFARWLQPEVDFTETRQLLERNAAEADDVHRAGARFELAQFYLARDHAIDALGILNLVTETKPELANDPAVKALRGAVRVALDRGDDATADLKDSRLDRIENISLWRAVALAEAGDWAKANDLFKAAQTIPAEYPPDLQWKFALAAAEAAIDASEVQRAYRLLEPLARRDLPPNVRNRSEYLRARALLAADDVRSAMPILERLMSDGDPWARAHAEAIWVEQALKAGKITPADAINRLERSRYAWTGDELEFNILRRLAELYLAQGNPRNAFERFHSAVTFFGDRPDVAAIQDEMTEAFVGLYVGPSADKLPPLVALSLYDDYRDLTPPGARGDDMIQHLADRLVQVDLLDRAAELLDYQVRNRLTGADKGRIGVRLAIVDLLDHNPQGALDGLDASEAPNLPPDIALDRQRLRARALLDLGFADKALAALTDSSRETDLLRAEIDSRGQRWAQAAQVLWRVVGSTDDKAIDPARSQAVVNLAVALVLSGDREGTRKLDDSFGAAMAKGPNAEAYAVLTRGMGDPGKGIDVAALSKRFTQLTQFQTAMDKYRVKLRNSGLSTVN